MGFTRLAIYIIGLLLVVAAAWVFLTQTPFSDDIPAGVALAIILFLVGLGVMVSANALDDTFYRRRVVRDDYGSAVTPARSTTYHEPARTTTYTEPGSVTPRTGETVVEERRY